MIVDTDYADNFFSARLYGEVWNEIDYTKKSSILQDAEDFLMLIKWKGKPENDKFLFPRKFENDSPDFVTPEKVKMAVCCLAAYINETSQMPILNKVENLSGVLIESNESCSDCSKNDSVLKYLKLANALLQDYVDFAALATIPIKLGLPDAN